MATYKCGHFVNSIHIYYHKTAKISSIVFFLQKLKVIHTPGHTPGHISLYCGGSRTLIAGDALTIEDGKLQGADPRYSQDMETALQSVEKLLRLDIRQVVCYHGGVYTGDVRKQLQAVLAASQ